jgi:RNA polymerase sigma-70 factor (ECF subfamily)
MTGRIDDAFADVLAAAQSGEGAAFTTLFESLARPVVGYLRGRGVEDADGAANEVFLRVFARIAKFDGDEAHFRSWVFTVARNLAVDEQRARQRRATCVAIDDCVARLASSGREPDQRIVEDESVHELLDTLSPDQRDVLLLRFVADLSIEETARALDRRAGAVKALQHRALDAIRRTLEQARRPDAVPVAATSPAPGDRSVSNRAHP